MRSSVSVREIIIIFILNVYMYVCVCEYVLFVCQKRAVDALELEVRMAVSHLM